MMKTIHLTLFNSKSPTAILAHSLQTFHAPSLRFWALEQRFSINVEAHTPSGRKNHFCSPCTICYIVFCIIREVRTPEVLSRTPWECIHPQLRTAALERIKRHIILVCNTLVYSFPQICATSLPVIQKLLKHTS